MQHTIVSDPLKLSSITEISKWLTTANVKTPRFNKNQMVCFVGGVGKIEVADLSQVHGLMWLKWARSRTGYGQSG